MPAHPGQLALCLDRRPGQQAFEEVGVGGDPAQGVGPLALDAEDVQFVVGGPGQDARLGGEQEPTGTGRRFTQLLHELAVGPTALEAGDLLLEHGRDEGLVHGVAAADAQPGEAPVQAGDERVVGVERRRVVVGAEQRGCVLERPFGTRSPGLGVEHGAVGPAAPVPAHHGQGRGAVGGAGGPPEPRGAELAGRVVTTSAQSRERQAEVDRCVEGDRARARPVAQGSAPSAVPSIATALAQR